MKIYTVVSPEMYEVEPVLDDGSGPKHYFRDGTYVRANTQREAIASALKSEDFEQWRKWCRMDSTNPFVGMKATEVTGEIIAQMIGAMNELRKFSKHDNGCSWVTNQSWCDCGCEGACDEADELLKLLTGPIAPSASDHRDAEGGSSERSDESGTPAERGPSETKEAPKTHD